MLQLSLQLLLKAVLGSAERGSMTPPYEDYAEEAMAPNSTTSFPKRVMDC